MERVKGDGFLKHLIFVRGFHLTHLGYFRSHMHCVIVSVIRKMPFSSLLRLIKIYTQSKQCADLLLYQGGIHWERIELTEMGFLKERGRKEWILGSQLLESLIQTVLPILWSLSIPEADGFMHG